MLPLRLGLSALAVLLLLLHPLSSGARTEKGHDHPLPPAAPPASGAHEHPAASPSQEVGLTERLGEKIPLDLIFTDESGEKVRLGDLIDRPTILAPVYYTCPNVCNFLQTGLAQSLPKVSLDPANYRVLSVSFDETDTPEIARRSQRNYYTAMGQSLPPETWHFLTGEPDQIRSLTDALGYRFQRVGKDFLHPVAAAVVSPEGTVVRYLHGTRFLPMDLSLALVEASEGKVGATIKRVLAFCFSYDPQGKRYVFNILRVSAVVVLATAGTFVSFLIYTGRRRKKD